MTSNDMQQQKSIDELLDARERIDNLVRNDHAVPSATMALMAKVFLKEAILGSWAFSKRTAIGLNNQRKAAIASRQARLIELKRNSQVQAFKTAFGKLDAQKAYINPVSWKKIQEYEAAVGGDPAALHAFAESDLVKNLIQYSQERSDFMQIDRERLRSTFNFETVADELFSAVGYDQITPVLKSIASRYKVSNAGNVVAGAILAGRKNVGGAAMAMADSVRVGAHNGAADTAFTNQLKYLVFAQPAASMSDIQRRYLCFAYRVGYLGLCDSAVASRAIFALIYSNNHCVVKPPAPHNKFSASLHGDFHNNFSHLIWTVQQAVAHLDEIRHRGGLREKLFSQDEIGGHISWDDDVPSPGFHIRNAD